MTAEQRAKICKRMLWIIPGTEDLRPYIAVKDKKKKWIMGTVGMALMIISILLILGVGVTAMWDGFRSGFSFSQFFFLRFVWIFTIYKAYDMIFFDWFLLCRFRLLQYYCPETAPVYDDSKNGYNLKSQLLKLLVLFPAVCALAAWSCTLFRV